MNDANEELDEGCVTAISPELLKLFAWVDLFEANREAMRELVFDHHPGFPEDRDWRDPVLTFDAAARDKDAALLASMIGSARKAAIIDEDLERLPECMEVAKRLSERVQCFKTI
jgi:hypothetical protein